MNKFIPVCFLLLLSSAVHSEGLIPQAESAFSAGRYAEALELFQAASKEESRDRSSASLRYNMAVCHYRLQQWPQAKALFAELHQEQQNDTRISYSLAVVEKHLGNTERAAALFLEVSALSGDETLRQAALEQYRRLGSMPNAAPQKHYASKPLTLSLELNTGNDDNVLEPADLGSSGRSDRFAEALLLASWHSGGPANERWVLDGAGYISRYDTVDDYDFDMLDVGLRKYFPAEFGRWYLGVRSNASLLSDNGYLHSNSLQLGAQGLLAESYRWKTDYQYRDHRSLSEEYDPFAGNTHRLNLNLSSGLRDDWRWKVAYRYEYDDRDDLGPELGLDDFYTSYSAQRHSVQTDFSKRNGRWQNKLSAGYRWSDYMDDNTLLDGSSIQRQDQRLKLSARSSWKLMDGWYLSGEYSYTDNQSNIENYDYDRHMVLFGVRWDW